MKFASIDPGKGGCLTLIEDIQPLEYSDMLMLPAGKLIDPKEIAALLWEWEVDHVVLEDVHSSPQMGVVSAANFSANSFGIRCLCAGMELPCHLITPQRWKTYWALIKKPKDAARLKAIEMFPDHADWFKRKGDVDRADSILMGLAWWKTVGVKL